MSFKVCVCCDTGFKDGNNFQRGYLRHLRLERCSIRTARQSVNMHGNMHSAMSSVMTLISGHNRQPLISRSCSSKGQENLTDLPEELQNARNTRRNGIAVSVAVLAMAFSIALATGVTPPEQLTAAIRPDIVLWTSLILVCTVCAAKLALGDCLHIELHDGRLWLDYAAVDTSLRLPNSAVLVKPTSDGRGNGAYAATVIAKGTILGDYDGELLTEAVYWRRYPSGMSDYCIRVDDEWTIDGAERASNTADFSACHMNHATAGTVANVARQTFRQQRRVQFSAQREIQVGEELLLDYGDVYWTGRRDQIIS